MSMNIKVWERNNYKVYERELITWPSRWQQYSLAWERKNYKVCEREFDYDLHVFVVVQFGMVQTIIPNTIEDESNDHRLRQWTRMLMAG